MTDKIVVLVTCGKREEADHLAKSLVELRLAACVNVIPGVLSCYWWEGKVTRDNELLLIIKTSRTRFEELRKEVQRLHSYSVPEIIALPIERVPAHALHPFGRVQVGPVRLLVQQRLEGLTSAAEVTISYPNDRISSIVPASTIET